MAGGVIDQIKERVDIVDLISSYLKLHKSGINYKARCPFHNEKTGSFFVSPERQIWHCFGCSLGGDAFGFVKQIEGVEFPEALRILAARAGINLKSSEWRGNAEGVEYENQKTKLLEISELAMRFFEKQLHQSAVGKQALAYLRDRGLTDESINDFHLGYAPDSWSALYDFLRSNYDDSEILNAGLIIKRSEDSLNAKRYPLNAGYYDRFRSRIIFPIFDLNGQTVGFTGRVFGELAKKEDVGKYVNSPQTPIYDKSRILYGLDKAKLDIRRSNRCLVVEGNTDVIMSHQAGVKNVVASSGTALTDGHLKIIKRYTDNLDLCFDADAAGTIATDRGVDLALAHGFNVGIVSIPDESVSDGPRESASILRESVAPLKDPADYVKINGAKWVEVSQNSQPFLEFYFRTSQKLFDVTTALGKKLFAQKFLPFLASMANKVEQAHWVGEVALVLKTKEEPLYQEMAAIKPKTAETPPLRQTGLGAGQARNELEAQNDPASLPMASFNPQEETLLSMIMKKPDLAQKISLEDGEFLSGQLKDLIAKINPAQGGDAAAVLSAATEAGNKELVIGDWGLGIASAEFAYLKSQELWKDFKDHELEEEFDKLLGQIRKRAVSARLADLEYDIKTAEKEKNKERLSALVAEFSKISKGLT